MNKLRADNCTAVTALLDPPGPPLSGLLAWQKLEGQVRPNPSTLATTASAAGHDAVAEVEDTNADSRPSCSSSMTDFSELSALLSEAVPVPVTGYEPPQRRTPTPPKSIMVHRDERLELDPGRAEDLGDPAHRVLRNRTLGVSGLDNKCPKKGAALLGGSLRKKVVTVEVALTQQLRKRPMTRSSHDNNSTEDRNASDTENQIKKSRRSLPVSASHRILRSSATMSSLVRTLRSQDSNLHAQSHYRKKRSRSFTPVKRRKQWWRRWRYRCHSAFHRANPNPCKISIAETTGLSELHSYVDFSTRRGHHMQTVRASLAPHHWLEHANRHRNIAHPSSNPLLHGDLASSILPMPPKFFFEANWLIIAE